MTERVTLITGASAGIGTELARVFASNGHRVALVARRADRLAALADEIDAAGGAAPIVIACDLEQPDAGDESPRRWPPKGCEVEYVVNNAGFGLFGNAIELDRAEQLDIIAVNIRAMTDLSLRFSDSLIRHRGGILNVGSIAGFLPGPGMAVYYASKAYVLSFTEALRGELAPAACASPRCAPVRCRRNFRRGRDSHPDLIPRCSMSPPSDVAKAGLSRADGQQARGAARSRHQDRAVSAAAVSARVYPGGGRPFSAAETLR